MSRVIWAILGFLFSLYTSRSFEEGRLTDLLFETADAKKQSQLAGLFPVFLGVKTLIFLAELNTLVIYTLGIKYLLIPQKTG